jgi:hypothetical protein
VAAADAVDVEPADPLEPFDGRRGLPGVPAVLGRSDVVAELGQAVLQVEDGFAPVAGAQR